MDRQKNKKIDKKLSIALMSSFVILTFQYSVLISFQLSGTSAGEIVQAISKVLVGLAYLYAFPLVAKRDFIPISLVYYFTILIFLFHFLIFPENRSNIISMIFPVFFMSLPSFVYTLAIEDMSILKKYMIKASYIIFVIGIYIGIQILTGAPTIQSTYSMSLSYYLLFPTIIFIDIFIEELSLGHLLIAVISLVIILLLGSRGAIAGLAAFILLKSIKSGKSVRSKIITSIIIFLFLVVVIYHKEIAEKLYYIFITYNIESRTLRLFAQDNLHLSSRDIIVINILNLIKKNPILGFGIAGDRSAISPYAHNIVLEIVGNFGVIVGGLLLLTLFILILKGLLKKNKDEYDMVIMWLSLGFIHLLVSGSYLIDIKFWIFLGILINLSVKNKVKI